MILPSCGGPVGRCTRPDRASATGTRKTCTPENGAYGFGDDTRTR
jgi:hypothetical protein